MRDNAITSPDDNRRATELKESRDLTTYLRMHLARALARAHTTVITGGISEEQSGKSCFRIHSVSSVALLRGVPEIRAFS